MNQETTINSAMTESTSRDYLFDNLKAILIILVVWGHMLTSMREQSDVIKTIYIFVFFFHMPVMVYISGYFSKNLEKIRSNAFTTFFIPYLILNVFSCIYKILILQEPYQGFRFFRPSWGLWYLLVLFIWRFFLKDLVRIRFLLPLNFIFALVCGFSKEFSGYFELSRIVCLLPFFLLGYYSNKEHIDKIRRMPKIISFGIIAATAVLSTYIVFKNTFDIEALYLRQPYLEGAEIENLFFRILIYVVAILMGIAIINLTSEKKTFLSGIGISTMTIYVLHLYTIPILEKLEILKGHSYLYLVYSVFATFLIVFLFTRPVIKKGYDTVMDKLSGLIIKEQ